MAKLQIIVCDICEDPSRPAKTYTIRQDDRNATGDRCEEHAAGLEAFLEREHGKTGTAARRKRAKAAQGRTGGRGFSSKVATMEELEAMKKQA